MTGSTAADISGLYAMLGRQEGSMILGNHDNGSRQTKTREMAKDYLARAGRRQNIRPGAFIHSGRKRPNPITARLTDPTILPDHLMPFQSQQEGPRLPRVSSCFASPELHRPP